MKVNDRFAAGNCTGSDRRGVNTNMPYILQTDEKNRHQTYI